MKKPKTFSADLAQLPMALAPLTKHKRWLVWRWEWTGKKWDKPPYKSAKPEKHAATDNPATWSSYAAAVKAVKAGEADGIGYVLTDGEIAAEDLDDCRNPDSGKLTPWAQDLVDEARRLGAYVETTVSGAGLRIIGTAVNGADYNTRLPIDDGGKVELYRRATRYITISGLQHGRCKKLPNIDACSMPPTSASMASIKLRAILSAATTNRSTTGKSMHASPSRQPMITLSGLKMAAPLAKNTAKPVAIVFTSGRRRRKNTISGNATKNLTNA